MIDFLAMNGYGFYIWSAYGMAALVLIIEQVRLRSRYKSAIEEARLATPDDSRDPAEGDQ
jgi:heme exporter protein CcmD